MDRYALSRHAKETPKRKGKDGEKDGKHPSKKACRRQPAFVTRNIVQTILAFVGSGLDAYHLSRTCRLFHEMVRSMNLAWDLRYIEDDGSRWSKAGTCHDRIPYGLWKRSETARTKLVESGWCDKVRKVLLSDQVFNEGTRSEKAMVHTYREMQAHFPNATILKMNTWEGVILSDFMPAVVNANVLVKLDLSESGQILLDCICPLLRILTLDSCNSCTLSKPSSVLFPVLCHLTVTSTLFEGEIDRKLQLIDLSGRTEFPFHQCKSPVRFSPDHLSMDTMRRMFSYWEGVDVCVDSSWLRQADKGVVTSPGTNRWIVVSSSSYFGIWYRDLWDVIEFLTSLRVGGIVVTFSSENLPCVTAWSPPIPARIYGAWIQNATLHKGQSYVSLTREALSFLEKKVHFMSAQQTGLARWKYHDLRLTVDHKTSTELALSLSLAHD